MVSATRVRNGGASANGVNKSDGEVITNVALSWLVQSICGGNVGWKSFSSTTSIKRQSPKNLGGPTFLCGLACLDCEFDGITASGALSSMIGLLSEPSISAESGISIIARWSVLTNRFGLN